GAAAANSVTLYRRHSVGKAIPGTQISIDSFGEHPYCGGYPTGEIQIKGPSVMPGYYERPEETAKALDRDGWFRTGDLGYLNAAGYLFITGRIKDIIVLSTGKKVSPEPIEQKLKLLCPDIEQICLVGDNKTKIAALVFFTEYTTTALEKFEKAVEMVNCELEEFKRIQNYKVIGEPFSLEQDELTPTMKLKRQKIQEHYRETITDLYND
ncbi:MAG: AMP-binding protein, partial [Parcubacteria group bacterium]|nr:AMP-binding protein [Parcubacteria group bacterium]